MRQFVADVLFDRFESIHVRFAGQRECFSRCAGTRSSPDTMNVVFWILRQVEIEYVRDVIDMQPARSHVCTHEHFQRAVLETFEQLHALALIDIAG